tara:strand:+ start:522 stop:1592 length:1071 start_codon:yes stop_codon:yes gene_type:complete
MENDYKACKNCEEEFQEDFEFCPHCGQKAKDDLTMGVLFYNTISNYFSFDARFFKSFLPLMFRPGYLARKFVEGKRLLYLHPAQYYLFVSVLFFFLFSFQAREYTQQMDGVLKKGFETESISSLDKISKKALDSNPTAKITEPLKDPSILGVMDKEELKKLDSLINENVNSENTSGFNLGSVTKKLDSLIAIDAPDEEQLKAMGMAEDANFLNRRLYTRMLKFYKNSGGGILQAFFDSIPIALFILLPIFAVILKIFFWKRGSFAHHLVFSFYFFSFLFVVLGIILSANYFWSIPSWISLIVALSTYLYLLIAIRKFYCQGYFISFIKTGMVTFIYLLFVLPIALGIMAVTSFFFY